MSRYSGYERTIRTGRSKKRGGRGVGGMVAGVIALVLIFAAGFLFGHLYPTGAGTQISSTGGTSSVQGSSSSEPPSGKLPDDAATMQPPAEIEALSPISPIPLDQVSASAYIVIDRLSGEVLLQKNADARIYPASTTKIMTTAHALDLASTDTPVTATAHALSLLSYDASTISLAAGETMSLGDMIYATMLPSACDAANAIADGLGQSLGDFVAGMVQKAKAIGCTGTYFVNPSGIHSEAHFSTVSDLARMEAYARRNPFYRTVTATRQYNLPATNLHPNDGWGLVSNSNPLLENQSLFAQTGDIVEINGSKTGTTTQGGYSLVCSAVTKSGVQLTAVISGIGYQNGKGALNRVPDMAAVLSEGARIAEGRDKHTVIEAQTPLAATLAGGVDALLPEWAELVPKQGLAVLSGGEAALQNGETAVFYDPSAFQAQAVFYSDAAERIAALDKGEEKTVGVLKIAAGDQSPVEDIPLIIRAKS